MSNGISNIEPFRARIGGYLVIGSSLAVFLLAIAIIVVSGITGGKDSVKETTQLIFTAVLPLIGTWVGTVLAFYFSKENFEAARQGTIDLVRAVSPRLESTRVADKMIRANAIIKATVPDGKQMDDLLLKDIDDLFTRAGVNGAKVSRLLIVDARGVCLSILHRSVWAEMLNQGARQQPAVNPQADSFGKLLSLAYPTSVSANLKEFIVRTMAFVAENRSVADAKAAMEAKPLCQDVIVTASGKDGEPMLGWISNVDIMLLSQA